MIKAIILAAGKSSRMGIPKWKLCIPTGETFLEYLGSVYHEAGIKSVMVVNKRDYALLRKSEIPPFIDVVINPNPGLGRISSIQKGIEAAGENRFFFVHNIDNPFICTEMIQTMLRNQENNVDVAIPVFEGKGGHPVLITKKVADALLQCRPPLPVFRDFLNRFSIHKVEYNDPRILLNINTSSDYDNFRAIPLP
jgi:molybdenum cofactor cytidylyltransferase